MMRGVVCYSYNNVIFYYEPPRDYGLGALGHFHCWGDTNINLSHAGAVCSLMGWSRSNAQQKLCKQEGYTAQFGRYWTVFLLVQAQKILTVNFKKRGE